MASKVEICNMALSSIGSKQTIQSLDTDNGVEAGTLKLHYDQALQTALVYTNWSFATKTATSALLSADPPTDWIYMYAEPANMLRIIEIVDAVGNRLTKPRKLKRTVYDGQRVILTDTESPVWRYIYNNTDPVTYSPMFIDALVASLASRVAMPLTRKRELRQEALADYVRLISAAAADDANGNTDNDEPRYMPEWLDARGYSSSDPILRVGADGTIQEIPGNL